MIDRNRSNWRGIRLGIDGTIERGYIAPAPAQNSLCFVIPADYVGYLGYISLLIVGNVADYAYISIKDSSNAIKELIAFCEVPTIAGRDSTVHSFWPVLLMNAGDYVAVTVNTAFTAMSCSWQYYLEAIDGYT